MTAAELTTPPLCPTPVNRAVSTGMTPLLTNTMLSVNAPGVEGLNVTLAMIVSPAKSVSAVGVSNCILN